MPWKETCPMQERMSFVADWLKSEETMVDLCARYGISRTAGYKWVSRYQLEGPSGFHDRPRIAHHHPHATPDDVVALLVEARQEHPKWGPRKLLAYLVRRHPGISFPAASTVGEILKRHGLVSPRRRRRRVPESPLPIQEADRPNAVWPADFKGQFKLGNGQYCYPLTMSDSYSRYLLRCQALAGTRIEDCFAVFESAFREYGLPDAILTDNGVPFASATMSGLSRLSLWWVKLGIQPLRTERGPPEQNGRHERMHRTLKAEATRPPRQTLSSQQRVFHRFRKEYNEERPHEALGQHCPADVYRPSSRIYPNRVPEPEYPGHFFVRSVYSNGQITFRNHVVNFGQSMAGEQIGFEEIADSRWCIHFAWLQLGVLDEHMGVVVTDERIMPTREP